MRPSSSSSRRQRFDRAAQYELPFLVETENPVRPNQAASEPESSPAHRAETGSDFEGSSIPGLSHPKKKNRQLKPPVKANASPTAKLLVSREEAASMVSLSVRSIDYLLASKQLPFRKIGTRTMIPVTELQRFARMNHPERIAS